MTDQAKISEEAPSFTQTFQSLNNKYNNASLSNNLNSINLLILTVFKCNLQLTIKKNMVLKSSKQSKAASKKAKYIHQNIIIHFSVNKFCSKRILELLFINDFNSSAI